VSTGGGQQHFGNPKLVFDQSMAFPGKCPIARQLPARDRFLDELKLFSGKEWTVKRDMQKLDLLLINAETLKLCI
jgi:hypothetical protein